MYWMDMTEQEIADAVGAFGVPKFRIKQVVEWLRKGVRPKDMTNLPKDLRAKLETIPFGGATIYDKRVSPKDGTIKYLFELEDGNLVEGVLMRYSYGNTVCLSTQVGCNMGCRFCASTLEGCVRSLRPGEMLSFLAEIERDEPPAEGKPRTVTNIVLMGSGEPACDERAGTEHQRAQYFAVDLRDRAEDLSADRGCAARDAFDLAARAFERSPFRADADQQSISDRAGSGGGEGVRRQNGTPRRIRIRADRRKERFRGGRRCACRTAQRAPLPRQPDSAESGKGARTGRRDESICAPVLRMA